VRSRLNRARRRLREPDVTGGQGTGDPPRGPTAAEPVRMEQ